MQSITVKNLGLQSYSQIFAKMQEFTNQRNAKNPDEIWFLQHYPVFTQGQAGRAEHLLHVSEIPVVKTDRGGQITYHGPGQLIAYLLLDVKRLGLGVRALVSSIEQAIIETLKNYDIKGCLREKAPGVYVNHSKIASLGLRIRKGCSYHGLALNVKMDQRPWQHINPCGYQGLKMTQMADFNKNISIDAVQKVLQFQLIKQLRKNPVSKQSEG